MLCAPVIVRETPQPACYKRVVDAGRRAIYLSPAMIHIRSNISCLSRKLTALMPLFFAGFLPLCTTTAHAQVVVPTPAPPTWTTHFTPEVTHVIVPQHRVLTLRPEFAQGVVLKGVDAAIVINGSVAHTTLEVTVENRSLQIAEAVVLVPVPAHCTVTRFSYSAANNALASRSEGIARVMPKADARALYDSIVRASRDPGLLEFAGSALLRSSVFPIAAGSQQRMRIEWEELLQTQEGRIDYMLPRSESVRQSVPWTVQLTVAQSAPIAAVYSPSHGLVEVRRTDARTERQYTLDSLSQAAPGPFMVSVLSSKPGETVTSIAAYPDPTQGGGYFMLLGGLAAQTGAASSLAREVTVVLDRSGSMAGGKLDQAKNAALQVIEGLNDGEWFNVIDYSNAVGLFAPAPVRRNAESVARVRAHLASLHPSGGTNISDALTEALRQPHTDATLGIVLFLTDGLPTVGQTSERAIREIVEKGNLHQRRVYTIGVGADVNVPLLDRVADLTRARTTYIMPSENVELKVAQVAQQLRGPVLADVSLTARLPSGAEDTARIRDLAPRRIPDVFAGEQLVVFGSYLGETPTILDVSARSPAGNVAAKVPFDPKHASTQHGYVARLWATRRIAELLDEVRQFAGDQPSPALGSNVALNDPRVSELVDEIVRLSGRFGVLTEYTAFFADEGTNLGDWKALAGGCQDLLQSRAAGQRSGTGAVNQGINFNEMKGKSQLAYDNRFVDQSMRETRIMNVQQVSDRCFYNNTGTWIDSQLVASKAQLAAPVVNPESIHLDETIEFGSDRHLELVNELAQEGRQSTLSLLGDTIIRHHSKNILVRNPQTPGC